MSSLKKFDYRIKDNRRRNIFLCGIVLVLITIVGVKLFNSYASFSNETNELTMVNAKTKVYPTAVEKITELSKTSTNSELRLDETDDNNLRYIGKNPSNYVKFNDELWRIIGVMNNIEDANGNKDTRIKLIKAESLGQISWDNKCPSNEFNETFEKCVGGFESYNNWEESSLKELLNGPYLNSTVSDEYNRWTKGKTTTSTYYEKRTYEKIDFSNTGIKEKYHNMIDTIKYKLGGPYSDNSYELTSTNYYNIERSETSSDNPSEWVGQIGLMYPSDYGFATSGGVGSTTSGDKIFQTSLETCLSIPLYNWNQNENFGCRGNDWLYQNTETNQWTITPVDDEDYISIEVYGDNIGGGVSIYDSKSSFLVNPVFYLKPKVRITGGTGTKEDPFTLLL